MNKPNTNTNASKQKNTNQNQCIQYLPNNMRLLHRKRPQCVALVFRIKYSIFLSLSYHDSPWNGIEQYTKKMWQRKIRIKNTEMKKKRSKNSGRTVYPYEKKAFINNHYLLSVNKSSVIRVRIGKCSPIPWMNENWGCARFSDAREERKTTTITTHRKRMKNIHESPPPNRTHTNKQKLVFIHVWVIEFSANAVPNQKEKTT